MKRRDFLKGVAAVAAVPAIVRADSPIPDKTLSDITKKAVGVLHRQIKPGPIRCVRQYDIMQDQMVSKFQICDNSKMLSVDFYGDDPQTKAAALEKLRQMAIKENMGELITLPLPPRSQSKIYPEHGKAYYLQEFKI